MSDSDPYVFPGTQVLKNTFGILDPEKLERMERRLVMDRFALGSPKGDFDLKHLRAIHHHLFQDIYDWAGELRSVEINKGGSQFQFKNYIDAGMADVHRRLVDANFYKGSSNREFAEQAGNTMGDVNYIHPFREGNGRTQLVYLQQLAERAGHSFNLRKIKREEWMKASKLSFNGDYKAMSAVIQGALSPGRERGRSRKRQRD